MEGRPFTLGFDIAKVDEEKRQVWGFATVETPDKQGDIVDYQASIEAFRDWPGNVREQHDPKRAVGKAIVWTPDEARKGIWLGVQISRSRDGEDTWTKIREGVLKGFSIGGSVLEQRPEIVKTGREAKTYNRITKYRLNEVSIVDNPACPEATIQLVKSVDGRLQATDVLDVEPQDASARLREGLRKCLEGYTGRGDLSLFANIVRDLNEWISSEWEEAKDDEGATPDDVQQLDLLRQAFTLIHQAALLDFNEYYGGPGNAPGNPPPAPPPAAPAAPTSPPPAPAPGEVTAAAQASLRKDGRFTFGDPDESAADEQPSPPSGATSAVQHIHDLTVQLGAHCQPGEHADHAEEGDEMTREEIERAVSAAVAQELTKQLAPANAGIEQVATRLEKAIGDLERRLEQRVAETVDALEKRVSRLEQLPAPDPTAPVVRPVEKTIGGVPDPNARPGGISKADVEVLEELQRRATDPFVKQNLGFALAALELKRAGR